MKQLREFEEDEMNFLKEKNIIMRSALFFHFSPCPSKCLCTSLQPAH